MTLSPTEILLYWIIPLFAGYSVVVSYFIGSDFYQFWVFNPFGFVETFVGTTLLLTAILGIYILTLPQPSKSLLPRAMLFTYVCAVIFFLGEDMNWGQYYREKFFGYEVHEYFKDNNKEMETNLHNMSGWFNQKPRFLVLLWVLVTGVLFQLGWQYPKNKTNSFIPEYFWPDKKILPLGIMVITARLPERLSELAGQENIKEIRYSEVQEIFLALFMLMFLLQIYKKLKPNKS